MPDADERISIRDGASSLGWGAEGDWTLTIVTPGVPDEIAAFPSWDGGVGGYEFVVSDDERYLALFLYSGQSTQGFELFTLRPAFKHIGGVPETYGHGGPPVFSPDGRWLVMFMDSDYCVRGTGEYAEDLYDGQSDARIVLDWAYLHVLRLPELTRHSVAVGADILLSTDPEVYLDWDTYDAVQFTAADVLALRMPDGRDVPVSLPPEGPITVRDPFREPSAPACP